MNYNNFNGLLRHNFREDQLCSVKDAAKKPTPLREVAES
jgi:hypothetical protein